MHDLTVILWFGALSSVITYLALSRLRKWPGN
jgi:hypothetical protein